MSAQAAHKRSSSARVCELEVVEISPSGAESSAASNVSSFSHGRLGGFPYFR